MSTSSFTAQFGTGQPTIDLRAVVAAWLGLERAELTEDSEPFRLGLDSLGMMTIINQARRAGVEVTFEQLAQLPTIGEWETLAQQHSASPSTPPPHVQVDETAPFDLAPMQHAYWAGRLEEQELGGVATHLYNEFDGQDVDPQRLERAVRGLMQRHGMLRASFGDDGMQRILDTSPWPGLTVHDLRGCPDDQVQRQLDLIRRLDSHRMLDVSAGEVFDVALSLLPSGATRLHVNLDMIAADAASFRVLMADLASLYDGQRLPELSYSYPRYLADRRRAQEQPQRAAARARARAWWQDRLADFPGPPDLPRERSAAGPARVRRHHHWLDPEAKDGISRRAHDRSVTPAMVLATVFAEVLGGWSGEPRFMLNLPLFDREDLDPDVAGLVGDFSSSVLLAADVTEALPFRARAEHLQGELRAAISHAAYPGVDVLRDLSREAGGERVLAPVVYTSALNLGELFDDGVRRCFGTPVWIISQGPQVWLDAQVTELDGGILVNWDVREDVFPAGVVEAMFDAYRELADRLAADDEVWDEPVGDLRPAAQREQHAATNATAAPQRLTRLHEGFFEHAGSAPERAAVHWVEEGQPRTMSYGALAKQALAVSATLQDNGLRRGDAVGITLPKGPDQVVAVFGVLAAGGVYVPVGTDQPMQRRRAIHESAGIGWLLTTRGVDTEHLPGAPVVLDLTQCVQAHPLAGPVMPEGDDAAYVLFTSGSTGSPKGVQITHRGATNTVEDLNERFGIGANDRVLAVSGLNFDLSVYDIFGLLAAGGAVVVTREDQRRDAESWLELWATFPVTVWNSVPILLDMLLTAAEPDPDQASRLADLRLVMLGGDWVGLDLPGRLRARAPDCRCAVLGGATEASIQSVLYEVDQVDPTWRSIPYGRPLRNQQIRVVDAQERDRPDLAAGELWLGGAGVGGRYQGDDELTADRFVTRAGERWYRTGDLVRRRLDGELEIIGRTDFQVKIAGNRIDLGEVEAAVRADERVRRAVAVALTDADGPPRLRVLVAAGEHATQVDLAEQLMRGAARALPSSMLPEHIAVVAELPLGANGKIDRRAVRRLLTQGGSDESRYDPPRGVLETAVTRAWAQVLDVDRVGRDDDFFRLGGDSLTATRSVALLRGQDLADGGRVGGVRLGGLLRERTVAAFAATLHVETADARTDAGSVLRPDPAARYQPFRLTEVQHAYLLGRDETVPLGGIGANFYLELDGPALDEQRWCEAWQRLIDRHDMVRAVLTDGQQHVLESVEPYVPVNRTAEDAASASAMLQRLRHRSFDLATWPAFETETVQYGQGRARVGLVIDPAVFDGLSVKTILAELAATYADPGTEVPAPGMTFRDYVISVQPSGQELAQAEAYWTARLDDLPPGPALPLVADPAAMATPRFERRANRLAAAAWTCIKVRAREHGLTPSAVLLTSYARVLSRWSAQPDLTLNLTLFDRRAVHADVDRVVGDFSSLLLLDHRPVANATWLSTARATQEQLAASLEHRAFSAVQVQQRLAHRAGLESAVFPVVFTSTLGVGGGLFDGAAPDFPVVVDGGSQTPQVWLDHQVVEQDGALLLSWDSVQGLFPDGLLDAMFSAYLGELEHLAQSSDWDLPIDLLAQDQRDVRARANATGEPSVGLLHASFFELARRRPDACALLWGQDERVSYGLLATQALRVASYLQRQGVRPGDTVGVSLPKGPDQIVAVLGVLAAGGVYVPIGIGQPASRRERIARAAGICHLLTDLRASMAVAPLAGPHLPEPGAPAYIVFTSGSTGEPKGVQMSHQAAANTIGDISQRFGIGPDDRVLAVSALEFDLSVYDIFGLLGAGGALVVVGEDERRDPDAWHRLCARHGVTVWNTVPMLLDMFVTAAGWQTQVSDTLRLALVSGDWVGLDLLPRLRNLLPQCRLIAMGGATEAGIWSNYFEVGTPLPGWSSVPYGLPLGAQQFRVVDALGRDCPDWVPGELWIGGASLADGYRGDPDRTAASFPTVNGQRWYRTGDIGRYRPGGLLEFLGRRDTQVKVRGHRIELGEIEAVLTGHPEVRQALPILLEGNTNRIGAVVVGNLDASTVKQQAVAHLPGVMVPDRIVVVPHLPLTANGKVDRSAVVAQLGADDIGLVGSTADSAGPAVLDRVSRTWSQVLGVQQVGPRADFFALGGDSLAATRVVALLRAPDDRTGEVLTGAGVGVLFARPVLADFAAALQPVTTAPTVVTVVADAEARFEPFPLTEVQQAYLRGRAADMSLGGIGTTYFLEFAGDTLDVNRWQDAWRRAIERHDMLRVVIEDGQQRVLPTEVASSFEVSVRETDCAATASEILRESLCGRSFALDQWPAYDTSVVRHLDGVRVGVVVDYLPLDGRSLHLLLSELAVVYVDPAAVLPDLDLTFRDYVLADEPPQTELMRSQAYWNARLGSLPPAPQLPLARDPATLFAPRFTRREARVDADRWERVKKWARSHAVTPSAVLLACYATVLSRWSTRADLTLNLTLFDRRDVHPQVGDILGDFTTLLLLEHRPVDGEDVVAAARRLQSQLAVDLDHRSTSAVWVQRELARHTTPAAAAMPVVFTSTLGMSDDLFDRLPDGFPAFVAGASQTPQVWLDHQVMEQRGELVYHWDAAEDLFTEATLDEMFAAYRGLVEALPAADLDALPFPARPSLAVPPASVGAGPVGRTAPRGAVEERVAHVWSQLLDVTEIHREDSFFALGGDSLLATRLIGRLVESGLHGATMAALFARPVLQDFCADVRIVSDGPRELVRLEPDPHQADQPFEATEVQRAYWVGRHGDVTLGGVGAHYYSEFDGVDVDLGRMERAWDLMVGRHAELRSVFTAEGQQQLLPADAVPTFRIERHDVEPGASEEEVDAALAELRERMSHQVFDPSRWPLFDVRAVAYRRAGQDRTRIGVGLDNIVLDGLSMMIVFSEVEKLYRDPEVELPSRAPTFRDYRTQVRPEPALLEAARDYWSQRLDDLPAGPQLPLATEPAELGSPRFVRHQQRIPAQEWRAARSVTAACDLTPAVLLLSCYAEVLSRWSAQPDLTITLTLFDRRDVHPEIDAILGDFTSLLLLAYRTRPGDRRLDRARRLRDQLARDLAHRDVSAVWVQREQIRRTGAGFGGAPVVFTSGLGLGGGMSIDPSPGFPQRVWGISQTPQIWLDQQVSQTPEGDLAIQWDAVEGLIPADVREAMFTTYCDLVREAADPAWAGTQPGTHVDTTWSYATDAPRTDAAPAASEIDDGPPLPGTEEVLASIWGTLLDTPQVTRASDFFALGGDSLLATRMVAAVHHQLDVALTLREVFLAPTLAATAARCDCEHEAAVDVEEGEL